MPSFEWDDQKERLNMLKHGLSFWEAQLAFFDPKKLTFEDAGHSQVEPRFYCVGMIDGGVVTVRYALRGPSVRIIGAGYWREGRRLYEKENRL